MFSSQDKKQRGKQAVAMSVPLAQLLQHCLTATGALQRPAPAPPRKEDEVYGDCSKWEGWHRSRHQVCVGRVCGVPGGVEVCSIAG